MCVSRIFLFLFTVITCNLLPEHSLGNLNSIDIVKDTNYHKINSAICSSLGYLQSGKKHNSCIKERNEYDKCVVANNKKKSEFTEPPEEICLEKSLILFPDNLSSPNHRNVVVRYSQNEEYKININDAPQYTQTQLQELRKQFIDRCTQERKHMAEYVVKTKLDCSNLLQLSKSFLEPIN